MIPIPTTLLAGKRRPYTLAAGVPEQPDLLGEQFRDEEIYEINGVQAVFQTKRVGDTIVYRAVVQNCFSTPRTVAFQIKSASWRTKVPGGEFETTLAGGEVGEFELVAPIPPNAKGKQEHYLWLRVRGYGVVRVRSARRHSLSQHIPLAATVLMGLFALMAGGASVGGGGLRTSIHVEKDTAGTRVAGAMRGSFRSLWLPQVALPLTMNAALSPAELARVKVSNRRIGIVAAITGVLSLFVAGFWYLHPAVFVVNGLDHAVTIEIGRDTYRVPAHAVGPISLPLGTTSLHAIDSNGDEVDAVSIRALPPSNTIVWNIAGAAPVFAREVQYKAPRDIGGLPLPTYQLFCGKHVLYLHADYAFEKPPKEVVSSSSGYGLTKDWVDVADGSCPDEARHES